MTHAASREPIFDRLTQTLSHDAQRVHTEIHSWFHPHHYHQYQPDPQGAPMSFLTTLEADARRDVETIKGAVENFVSGHLPKLADLAESVATKPVVQVALSAVLGPADEAMIVGLVQRLDQGAHQLAGHVTAAEQAQAPAEAPAGPLA